MPPVSWSKLAFCLFCICWIDSVPQQMPLFADCQNFYVNKIWNIIYTYTSSSARFVIFKEPSCFCACMCLFCLIFCPKKSLNLNLIQTEALVGQGSEVKISCKQTTNHLLLWPYGCVCVSVMAKGHTRPWQSHLGGGGKKAEKWKKVQTCFLFQTNQYEKVKSVTLTFARASLLTPCGERP